MLRVKICGITNPDDAHHALDAGADALGFVFHEKSARNISPELGAAIIRELPPFIQSVGLFVNREADFVNDIADFCGLDMIQLHGDEPPEYCCLIKRRVIKAIRVRDRQSLEAAKSYRVAGVLLDAYLKGAYGGTGHSFDWNLARTLSHTLPVILAGGLNCGNVIEAVNIVKPYAVDVSSGVESSPGKKDPDKVSDFIKKAKGL